MKIGTGPLGLYMQEHELTADDISERLSEKLGKEISPQAVRMWAGRDATPKAWAEALGIAAEPQDSPPFPSSEAREVAAPSQRENETRPTPPPGAPLAPVAGQVARERIAGMYGVLGSGIAKATHNPGIEAVVHDQADPIAAAWIKAAEENAFARRVVQLMSAGGATGELVVAHVVMLGGILYVTGGPDIGLYNKYARYRPQPQPAPATVAATSSDGAASVSSEATLAEPPSPSV